MFVFCVNCSSSSKCASPPIGFDVGKYACAKTFPGPSNGFPSPWLPLSKSMMMSAVLDVVSVKVNADSSDQICGYMEIMSQGN